MASSLGGKDDQGSTPREPRVIVVEGGAAFPRGGALPEHVLFTSMGTAHGVLALILFIFWVTKATVAFTQDLAVSLSASSVDLAALTIAVLSLLLAMQAVGHWFKVGLSVACTYFVLLAIGGYWIAFTWDDPADGRERVLTLIVCVAAGIISAVQLSWGLVWGLRRRREGSASIGRTLSIGAKVSLTPSYLLPVALVVTPNLDRITALIVLFLGGVLNLVFLVAGALYTTLTAPKPASDSSSLLNTLTQRWEREIQQIQRVGELKEIIRARVESAEQQRVADAVPSDDDQPEEKVPALIPYEDIEALVRRDQSDPAETIREACRSLVEDGWLANEGQRYWRVPTAQHRKEAQERLSGKKVIVLPAAESGRQVVRGVDFSDLVHWIAGSLHLPETIAADYLLPGLADRLLNSNEYELIRPGNKYGSLIFIAKELELSVEALNKGVEATQRVFGDPACWSGELRDTLMSSILPTESYLWKTGDNEGGYGNNGSKWFVGEMKNCLQRRQEANKSSAVEEAGRRATND